MPDFDVLSRKCKQDDVIFIGLAIDHADKVRAFLQTHPVSYPILIGDDTGRVLLRKLGNASGALPYTLVLDRDGKVLLRHPGLLPRATLDALLSEHATC